MTEQSQKFIDSGVIEGVTVRRPQRFRDDRGWVMEFFRQDELPAGLGPSMGYMSVTNPGVVRGPHEHLDQTDYFVFPGPGDFLLAMWDNRPDSRTYGKRVTAVCGESDVCIVIVPPGVVHGYCCISKQPGTCINVPNRLYKGEGKKQPVDEVRHENDPQSPYVTDFSRILSEFRS
jgi:dTDP-4-dehydrorhamnose 3,5-epimerase